jgi:hypothetical protein
MPNSLGDLNIEEAAKYLGVSVDVMKALVAAPAGPFFLTGRTKKLRAQGPWFTKNDLETFRPRLVRELAKLSLPHAAVECGAGNAKSVLAKAGIDRGAAILNVEG